MAGASESARLHIPRIKLGLGGGSLLQVANRSLTQMMSYLIDTPDGKVVMIDGGCCCAEDGEHLYELLFERGKKVNLWIITHAHSDHLGALLWLMENKPEFDLDICQLCFCFPVKMWLSGTLRGIRIRLVLQNGETK